MGPTKYISLHQDLSTWIAYGETSIKDATPWAHFANID